MDKDHRDLVCGLFTLATEILEDTHLVACRGQSSRRSSETYQACARRLLEASQRLSDVAGAIQAAIDSGNASRAG